MIKHYMRLKFVKYIRKLIKSHRLTKFRPYAEAVRAGVACIMTSYPYVNNSQPSQNGYLLNNILKTHLGFQGYAQSDWFAIKSGVAAILAGTDQDMPGVITPNQPFSFFGSNYTRAVRNGSVPEWRLNDAAVRIMTPYFYLGQDRNYPKVNLMDDPRLSIVDAQRQRHRTLAREIATAGTVLLKNTVGPIPKSKGLPLWKPTTITLFGKAAGPNPYGPNQYSIGNDGLPQFAQYPVNPLTIGLTQGTLAEGGGSGTTFCQRLSPTFIFIGLINLQIPICLTQSLRSNSVLKKISPWWIGRLRIISLLLLLLPSEALYAFPWSVHSREKVQTETSP